MDAETDTNEKSVTRTTLGNRCRRDRLFCTGPFVGHLVVSHISDGGEEFWPDSLFSGAVLFQWDKKAFQALTG
jgi:hypothetical protein